MPKYKPNWMPKPRAIANSPPALEYLSELDQILICQQRELIEDWIGYETANKYWVKNILGQDIYFAAESSEWGSRMCCGASRSFHIEILDSTGREAIHIFRPFSFGCPIDHQILEVYAPIDELVGCIVEEWTCFIPSFVVKNENGEAVLLIKGPCCGGCDCGCDIDFQVLSLGGRVVGEISKKWGGLVRELFSDATIFGITFPMDLDARLKAVMLGACFMIDFTYFER